MLEKNTFFSKTKVKRIILALLFLGLGSIITFHIGTGWQGGSSSLLHAEEVNPSSGNEVFKTDSGEREKIMYALQDTYREVAASVLPVVVEINVVEVIKQQIPRYYSPWDFDFNSPFSPFPYGNPDGGGGNNNPLEREFKKQGLGSGVIVRQVGNKHYVVTNNHVVGNADEISVRLYDGREFEGKIVGKDDRIDLALVYFESNDEIPVIDLGDSDGLMVGDIVFAVGNPLGFESTLTQGIISALARQAERGSRISDFTDYIQTDAAINPGNSGGALVNLAGDLIGINTWIASQSGGSVGIGFAIPVNNVKKAINDFIEKGRITYGWMGVSIADVYDAFSDIAEDLKIKNKSGALVLHLFKDSPADKAGVLPGDLIIKVDDQPILDSGHLTRVVGNLIPGTTKKITLIRYGFEKTVTIRFDARDEEKTIQENTKLWPGLLTGKITEQIRRNLNIKGDGVIVRGVVKGSTADIAGFREGDVITRMNGRGINNIMDFYKELNDTRNKEITFRIMRGTNELLLGLFR